MPEVSAVQAKELVDAGAQVVDVRTDVEYEASHIPGSRHVPLADLQAESEKLDRETPVVVYCRSGERSGPAADAFAASGGDAHSIEGGLLQWAEDGLPVEPEGGSVAENPNMPPR
jgi:rhodanese-related sulfurtransferase